MPDCPSTVRGPGGAGGTSAFGPGSWDGGGHSFASCDRVSGGPDRRCSSPPDALPVMIMPRNTTRPMTSTPPAPPPNHFSIRRLRRTGSSGGSGGPCEITSSLRGVASSVTVPVRYPAAAGRGAGVGSDGVTCTDGYTGTPAVSSRPGSGRAQGERSSGISLPVLQLRARPPPGGGTVGRLALRGRYRRSDAHHRQLHLVSLPARPSAQRRPQQAD